MNEESTSYASQSEQSTTTCTLFGKELDKGTCVGIGIVIAAAVVIGIAGIVLNKRFNKGKKVSGKSNDKDVVVVGKKPGGVVELYVGNLSYDMTEAHFRKEFERFGVVKSARIISHRTTGKSKGYGFVEMPHRKEAMIAIKNLNNRDILGRKLRVNEARNGSPRPE